MKIYRRIVGKIANKSMKSTLENILKEDLGQSYFSKDLDESSTEYHSIQEYVKLYNLDDGIIGTVFTDDEIFGSEVVWFNGGSPFSYPEPKEPKFLENAFVDACYSCGTYGNQRADFLIKKEPNLNPRKIYSLHWVGDKLFCTNELYEIFFKQLQFDKRAVQICQKNRQAENVVQILFPKAEYNLDINNLEYSICQVCRRTRYTPTIIGFFPLPKNRDFSIVETKEFFGSGHFATHRLLLTNDVMNEMITNKIARKHQFVPCR